MKFAFLFAVLIALVAVSSAAWTVDWATTTPATTSVTVGTTFSAAFTTDAAVPSGTAFTPTLAGITTDLTYGAGNVVRCKSGDKEAVVNGFTTIDLVATDVVTCQYRAAYAAASATTATITPPGSVTPKAFETKAFEAPVVTVDSASEQDSKLVDFSVTFSKLQANTWYGPIKFEYTYGTTKIATTPRVANSDFVTEIGTGVFFHSGATGFYIVTTTGTTGTLKATTQNVFPGSATETTVDYSLTVSLVDPSGADKWFSGPKAVATWTKQYGVTTTIGRANGVVTYTISAVTTTANPTAKFSISTFDEATVFGAGSTLKLNNVDVTTKAFTQEVTKAAGEGFQFIGTFPFTGAWTELATIDASVSGVSDFSSTEGVPVEYKYKIGSLTDGVIDYTVTVALSSTTTYTGSVKHVTDTETRQKLFLQQLIGDVRKFGEYNPDCSADNGSVSIGDKVTKDSADLNVRSMVIEGTVSKEKSIVVTCKQAVGAGDRSSDTVTLVTENSKLFKAVTTMAAADLKQALTVKSAKPITSQADWDAMITAVIAAIKAAFPAAEAMSVLADEFKTLEAKNFHYTNNIQHYGSHSYGFALTFGAPLQYYSDKGASLSFVIDLADGVEAQTKRIITADWDLFLSAPTAGLAGWTPAAVYLDGTTAASYEATQYVQYGSGVKCDTTAQCSGAYCDNGVCATIDLLTVAQQDAIAAAKGGSDSGSGASALFSGLAIVVAVVVALLA